jgi:hypothetical protein
MKKILFKYSYGLLISMMITTLLLLAACEDDENLGQPVILEVRNYAASPDDTAVQTIQAGQWVVVMGENLSGVSQVLFGSVPATVNKTFFTDQSIVIQVPSIPFDSVSQDKLHELTLVSEGGTTTFSINITGNPLITHVRNFAPSPNDTIVDAITPNQHINLIGFNLTNATAISFQGVNADLTGIIYTDSSVIVKVPDDFSKADLSQANKVTYTTAVGAGTFSIKIFDPEVLKLYGDPLWTLLTGGIGKEKTWVVDMDAEGKSKKFNGPIFFSGTDWGWGNQCNPGGSNCWLWDPPYQSWMPAPKDYGTMTFKLKGSPIDPIVTVVQKNLSPESNNGTFSGAYFLDTATKTITFTEVVPLNLGWAQIWVKASIITLTEDGLQLGFKHPDKAELEIYNYVPK